MRSCRNTFEAEVVRAFVAHKGVAAVKSMLTPSSTGSATVTGSATALKAKKKTTASRIRRMQPLPEGQSDAPLPEGSESVEQETADSVRGESEDELDDKLRKDRSGPRPDATGIQTEPRRGRF